jgi:hypothetical protein
MLTLRLTTNRPHSNQYTYIVNRNYEKNQNFSKIFRINPRTCAGRQKNTPDPCRGPEKPCPQVARLIQVVRLIDIGFAKLQSNHYHLFHVKNLRIYAHLDNVRQLAHCLKYLAPRFYRGV